MHFKKRLARGPTDGSLLKPFFSAFFDATDFWRKKNPEIIQPDL